MIAIPKKRRTVAAQIGHEHPVSMFDQGRYDSVPRANIVGKSVQQNDREPSAVTMFFIANVEHGGPHVLIGWSLGPLATCT